MLPENEAASRETTLAVLLTCHNRVSKTLTCLEHVFQQTGVQDVKISVYLVDDGSTDGTGEAVKAMYPSVHVIYGNGSLFWNGGMHRAFAEALTAGFNYYFWLNDDTLLYSDALAKMLDTHRDLTVQGRAASIIVASTKDPVTNEFTYGGYVETGNLISPLRLRLLAPGTEAKRCDTMCGNCVLVPKEVADRVGNIDPKYRHRWGDVDYGLRAKTAHCETWIAPGYLAACEANPNADRHRDHNSPFRLRLKELHSLKGLGKKDWLRFVRIHGGAFWIAMWVRPYVRLVIDSFR